MRASGLWELENSGVPLVHACHRPAACMGVKQSWSALPPLQYLSHSTESLLLQPLQVVVWSTPFLSPWTCPSFPPVPILENQHGITASYHLPPASVSPLLFWCCGVGCPLTQGLPSFPWSGGSFWASKEVRWIEKLREMLNRFMQR